MPTKQPEEAEDTTVAPEERDVEFASLAVLSISARSNLFKVILSSPSFSADAKPLREPPETVTSPPR
jgi:hypothetical protein